MALLQQKLKITRNAASRIIENMAKESIKN